MSLQDRWEWSKCCIRGSAGWAEGRTFWKKTFWWLALSKHLRLGAHGLPTYTNKKCASITLSCHCFEELHSMAKACRTIHTEEWCTPSPHLTLQHPHAKWSRVLFPKLNWSILSPWTAVWLHIPGNAYPLICTIMRRLFLRNLSKMSTQVTWK